MMRSRRFLVVLGLILLATGCMRTTDGASPGVTPSLPEPALTTEAAPDPDQVARKFLEAWKAGDYESMYALLSPLTKDALPFDDFAGRYQDVMRAGAFRSVEYAIVSSLVQSPQRAEVRFRVTLDSAVVGPITRENRMDLTRDRGEAWRVAWAETAILPELEGGRQLSLSTITPTRANIYDRDGDALAAEPSADQANVAALWLVPNEIGDEEAEESLLTNLRRLFDLASTDPILERYDAIRNTNFFVPLGEVPYEKYQRVGGLLASLGGVYARAYDARYYYGTGLTPFAGAVAPHAVGYVSQIQEQELEARRAQGYQGDEYVGRIGVEAAFEQELRGVPGGTLSLLDSQGNYIGSLEQRDPQPPFAVYTTLNRDLQAVAQRAIEGFAGAVVVLERDTGAVLAMASSPGFDPNLFMGGNPLLGSETLQMLNQADQPYVNRATSGLYPPGSIFKMITMAAALESGFFEPDTVYYCGLTFEDLPGITLYDWRYEKELPASGELTLQGGLERSCNPWFYHIGLELYKQGLPSAIPDMARGFGLGQATGIEIGDEAGQVPDPENALETLGEAWAARHPVLLAIGQSALQVTPLQVARYVAAIGNGGTLYRPRIIDRIQNAEGEVLEQFEPEAQGQLPVSSDNLQAIQEAMMNVVVKP
ncbi:MAG TPA: hypothetical protein ENL35_08305, partial [Chloroflexi bacterium]|nr:hypothetical protein [Chloroflexota bacterium]